MTSSQNTKQMVTKNLRCGDKYENYALNKIVIEGVDAWSRHIMREYWDNTKKANLHDLALHETSLLLLQRHDVTPKWTTTAETKQQHKSHWEKPWSSQKPTVNDVRSGSTSSTLASSRDTSGTSVLENGHTASQSSNESSDALYLLIANLDALSTIANAFYCRQCLSKNHMTSQ